MSQISIIKKSEIEKAKRFDAEYFKPEYLEIEKKLEKIKYEKLKDLIDKKNIVCGPFGSEILISDYSKIGIPLLRVQNLHNFFLNVNCLKFISTKKSNFLKKYFVSKNDIVVSQRGSVSDFSLIDKNLNFIISANLIAIKNKNSFNFIFLNTFLNSYYGKIQLKKLISGQVQEKITTSDIKNLKIPILPNSFQLQIETLVKSAHEKQNKAKENYKQAEKILLEELNLLDFEIKNKLNFTTTKKEVEKAERFDSEYFQPKYKEIIEKIENYEGGFEIIKKIFNFNKKNFYPKENEKYFYIPLSKVSNNGEIEKGEKECGKYLPTRARRKVKKGEIILSSIEGCLETSSLIEEEQENFIVSNGFYVFSSNKINRETLFVLVKSKIFIELLKKISKGAILGGYDLESFEKIKIPLINENIQQQIKKLIEESFVLRNESKELLEKAKKQVEDEIERLAK